MPTRPRHELLNSTASTRGRCFLGTPCWGGFPGVVDASLGAEGLHEIQIGRAAHRRDVRAGSLEKVQRDETAIRNRRRLIVAEVRWRRRDCAGLLDAHVLRVRTGSHAGQAVHAIAKAKPRNALPYLLDLTGQDDTEDRVARSPIAERQAHEEPLRSAGEAEAIASVRVAHGHARRVHLDEDLA